MKIEGAKALVTGANRGLGAAIAQALLDAGATVYGGARDPGSITNDRVIPVRLDVTNDDDIANAARACADVSIVVNNAGILRQSASNRSSSSPSRPERPRCRRLPTMRTGGGCLRC